MTITESTTIVPSTVDLDDVDVPHPAPRARRRRRTTLVVLAVAVALVAALLAGALTSGGHATPEAAADDAVVAGSPSFSTNEPGIETSSTTIERDGEVAATDEAAPADGVAPDPQGPGATAAQLGISTTSLAFGQHATTKTFTIENDGTAGLDWSAEEAKPWMSVDPAAGTVEPGASQVIEVSVDRSGLASGSSFQGDLTVATNGGDAVVHVSGSTPFGLAQPVPADVVSVSHLPVICSVNSPKGPKTTPIVAKISGPDIEVVKLYWSMGGGFPSGMDMVKSGPDTWMVPAFGNLPQGVVKIAVYAENQFGDELVERQIVVNHCP